jgi:hypothetical protein
MALLPATVAGIDIRRHAGAAGDGQGAAVASFQVKCADQSPQPGGHLTTLRSKCWETSPSAIFRRSESGFRPGRRRSVTAAPGSHPPR